MSVAGMDGFVLVDGASKSAALNAFVATFRVRFEMGTPERSWRGRFLAPAKRGNFAQRMRKGKTRTFR